MKINRGRSASEKLFAHEWQTRSKLGEASHTELEQKINDLTKRLKMDAFVERGGNAFHSRWENRPPTRLVARRILSVALDAAVDAHEKRMPITIASDFKDGSEHAAKALAALDVLFNWMSGRQMGQSKDRWRQHGYQALIGMLKFSGNMDWRKRPVERQKIWERQATALLAARTVIENLENGLLANSESLRGQNVGEPEKQEFVSILRDGWLLLFQDPPSVSGKNFSSFVAAAWEDIGGLKFESAEKPETFSHQIRQSVDEIVGENFSNEWQPIWF